MKMKKNDALLKTAHVFFVAHEVLLGINLVALPLTLFFYFIGCGQTVVDKGIISLMFNDYLMAFNVCIIVSAVSWLWCVLAYSIMRILIGATKNEAIHNQTNVDRSEH